jgi:DNA-binding transcriptional MerR regulator
MGDLQSGGLLSTKGASEYLDVPQGTLRYWRHIGVGPKSFRMGRRVTYRRSELEKWLRELEEADCRNRAA